MELKWKHTSQRLMLPGNAAIEGRNGWMNLEILLEKGKRGGLGRALWEGGSGPEGKIPFGKYSVQRTPSEIFFWKMGDTKPIGTALRNASQIRWPDQSMSEDRGINVNKPGNPTVILLWQNDWESLWKAAGAGVSTLVVTDGY